MNKIMLGRQVASFQCLIVLLKENNLAEGMKFVDFTVDLAETSVRRKNKYFILITKNVDYGLLQNRTGNANVHIVSQREDGTGVLIMSVTLSFITRSCLYRQRPQDNFIMPNIRPEILNHWTRHVPGIFATSRGNGVTNINNWHDSICY